MSQTFQSSFSPRKKRTRLEFETVSHIKDPKNVGEQAFVEGVVTSLSPKKGRFFDGCLEDSSGNVRFVGFNEPQRLKIEEFVKEQEGVKFTNCKIQRAYGGGDDIEIVLNDRCTITKSEKKFGIKFPNPTSMAMSDGTKIAKDITLSQLEKEAEFQRVNVKVEIAEVAEAVTLNDNRKLQNVTVADESGARVITLWENDVGKLVTGKTYRIENLMVKCYRGEFSLTSPKAGIIIEEAESLPEVVDVTTQDNIATKNNIFTLTNAKIISVSNFQCFRRCPVCKSGKVSPMSMENNLGNDSIGVCEDCPSTSLMSLCEHYMSSQLVVVCDNVQYKLRALGPQLYQIAQKSLPDSLSSIDLLLSENFACKYTEQMNIIDVSTCQWQEKVQKE